MKHFVLGTLPSLPEKIRNLPADEYGKALGRFRVATVEVAVIKSDAKLLLLKRKENPGQNEWWVCGTKLIGNESLEQGACRAIENELGLKINPVRIVDLEKMQFMDWPPNQTEPYGDYNQHNVVLLKITEAEINKIQLRRHEHSRYLWIDPKDVNNGTGKFLDSLIDICQHLIKKYH